MENVPREIRLEQRKNKIIEDLSVQFAQHGLPVEEYERLVEYINKAETERELAVIEKIARENDAYYTGADGQDQYESPGESAHYKALEDGRTSVALLSSRRLSGDYLKGRKHLLYNFLGSHIIEYAEGDLPEGRTEISVFSFLGDVKIKVPPNVKVRIHAVPILGSANLVRSGESLDSRSPELVINGTVILSSIMVRYSKRKFFSGR